MTFHWTLGVKELTPKQKLFQTKQIRRLSCSFESHNDLASRIYLISKGKTAIATSLALVLRKLEEIEKLLLWK